MPHFNFPFDTGWSSIGRGFLSYLMMLPLHILWCWWYYCYCWPYSWVCDLSYTGLAYIFGHSPSSHTSCLPELTTPITGSKINYHHRRTCCRSHGAGRYTYKLCCKDTVIRDPIYSKQQQSSVVSQISYPTPSLWSYFSSCHPLSENLGAYFSRSVHVLGHFLADSNPLKGVDRSLELDATTL